MTIKPGDEVVAKVFLEWIRALDEDVIQGEFGFEDGEFTVYADHWRPLFDEGLTPRQAYQRALDGFAAKRAEEDRERKENWARIQKEDAALLSRFQSKQDQESGK